MKKVYKFILIILCLFITSCGKNNSVIEELRQKTRNYLSEFMKSIEKNKIIP